jgi:serine/threonine protein phosphatase PrpC
LIESTTGSAWVANAGDSRAIYFDKNHNITFVSKEHEFRVGNEEWRRLEAEAALAKTRVHDWEELKFTKGRYYIAISETHALSPARAIGDHRYKKPTLPYNLLISKPDVTKLQLHAQGWTFLIGCDGCFEKLDNSTFQYLLRARKFSSLNEAARKLVKSAIDSGSTDNISVVIVKSRD